MVSLSRIVGKLGKQSVNLQACYQAIIIWQLGSSCRNKSLYKYE